MTDNGETSYAPKSPDFSSFFSQPPPAPSFPLLDDPTRTTSQPQHLQPPPVAPGGGSFYHPSHNIPGGSVPVPYTHAPPTPPAPHVHHHHQPPPQYQQPHSGPALHNFSSISPQQQGAAGPPYGHGLYDLTSTRQQQKPVQQYASQETYGTPQQLGYQVPAYPQSQSQSQSQPQPQTQTYRDTQIPVAQFPPSPHAYTAPPVSGAAHVPVPPAPSTLPHQHPRQEGTMPPRRATQQAPPPPVIDPSPVRTKFPTARIKRIMQADEEVGKVAQQTPIAVGKALELFMISMVSKSADVAKEKGQKRVTAGMLKQVVETDDQFDFLREIVSKVEVSEEKTKAARVKADTDSEDEVPEPKRRVRGGGRKKKPV